MQESGKITPLQQILVSSSGALLTSLFVTPLDVIKIRLQSQKTNHRCFLYCNGLMDHMCYCVNGNSKVKWYRRPSNFSGTINAMFQIARNEGVSSLWSGLSPTLVMAIPATVIYFTSYDYLNSYFSKNLNTSTIQFAPIAAGAIARSGTVTLISPLELIRTKMQSKPLSYREVCDVVRSSVKQSGFVSLWKGWGPTMFRDIPFSMMYWYFYEQFKRRYDHPSVFVKSFVCGFSSGLISGIVTLPLDVVKTKRQITLGEIEMSGKANGGNTTTIAVMRNIIRESGPKGLFVGILPRCAKIAPACAIMIGCYELGKSYFRQSNQEVGTF